MRDPYYADPFVEIYHGDAFEILPEIQLELVHMFADGEDPTRPIFEHFVDSHMITDPPFEKEAHEKAKTNKTADKVAEIPFAPITESERFKISWHAKRIVNGWMLAFCQAEAIERWRAAMLAAKLHWRRAQAWVKTDAMPQLTGDRPAQGYESIATSWAGPPPSVWNGGGKAGVYVHAKRRTDVNSHPTAKPPALMRELIELFSEPGDLILDPFCGGGSTLRAAKDCGRRAIGIELEKKWCDVAVKSMRQEVLVS